MLPVLALLVFAQVANADPWTTPIAGLGVGGLFLALFLKVCKMAYDDLKADRDGWRRATEVALSNNDETREALGVIQRLFEELKTAAEKSR